MEMRSFSLGD